MIQEKYKIETSYKLEFVNNNNSLLIVTHDGKYFIKGKETTQDELMKLLEGYNPEQKQDKVNIDELADIYSKEVYPGIGNSPSESNWLTNKRDLLVIGFISGYKQALKGNNLI